MKIHGVEFMIGSDPELFVRKGNTFVSGHDLIPGTKAAPFAVNGGAVQVDGTALEFNTEPAADLGAFHRSTNRVLDSLRNMIPGDFELVAAPTVDFLPEYFANLPEEAKELGCSPDWNAYTGQENPRPDGDVNFRSGAGHIHIGWTNVKNVLDDRHMAECRALTMALDVFLGVPSVLIDPDDRRRRLYGKAGAFRPKTYGMEYRVLSNFWVLAPKMRKWVFNNTVHAIERLMDRAQPLAPYGDYPRRAIDEGKEWLAHDVIENYSVPIPKGYGRAGY